MRSLTRSLPWCLGLLVRLQTTASHALAPRKGVFVGSGSEGLQMPEVCDAILRLAGKPPTEVSVLYLGTATYDLPRFYDAQTLRLKEAGCAVSALNVASTGSCASAADMAAQVRGADVIVVSGGNTLHAVQRWHAIGLSALLRQAMDRGCVLAGGSAGAVCWFDAGHSDSADPETYKAPFLAGEISAGIGHAPLEGQVAKPWGYLRVAGLGFFPGFVCPHADKVQSNGLLRIVDFDGMLRQHAGERGVCIDHFAALVVDGDEFEVLAPEGKPGSLAADGATRVTDRSGTPAIWVKDVTAGGNSGDDATGTAATVTTALVPPSGKLSTILRPATSIVEDSGVADCIAANPFDLDL